MNKFAQLKKACIFVPTITLKHNTMNINTIKSKVKKQFQTVEIKKVKKHDWGIFSVKVIKQMPRSTKIGLIFGEWNGGECTMGKIEWI